MARRKSLDDEMQFISSRELEAAADMLLREADMKDKGGKKTTKKSKADKDSKTEKVTKTRTVKVLKSDKSEKTEEGNAAEGEESTKAEAQKLSEEDEKLFNDTLERLLAIAKSRKSVIEDTEIIDAFKNKQEFLTDENMNRVIEFFEQNKVDVLTITDDDDDVDEDEMEEMAFASQNEYSQSISVMWQTKNVLTLWDSGYDYSAGAAHGMPWGAAKTFDLKNLRILTLDDIITESGKQAVLKMIFDQLEDEYADVWDMASDASDFPGTDPALDKESVKKYFLHPLLQ